MSLFYLHLCPGQVLLGQLRFPFSCLIFSLTHPLNSARSNPFHRHRPTPLPYITSSLSISAKKPTSLFRPLSGFFSLTVEKAEQNKSKSRRKWPSSILSISLPLFSLSLCELFGMLLAAPTAHFPQFCPLDKSSLTELHCPKTVLALVSSLAHSIWFNLSLLSNSQPSINPISYQSKSKSQFSINLILNLIQSNLIQSSLLSIPSHPIP